MNLKLSARRINSLYVWKIREAKECLLEWPRGTGWLWILDSLRLIAILGELCPWDILGFSGLCPAMVSSDFLVFRDPQSHITAPISRHVPQALFCQFKVKMACTPWLKFPFCFKMWLSLWKPSYVLTNLLLFTPWFMPTSCSILNF
jgi:hypothetical protein